MTVETTDTRNVCVRGEFVAKIQVCLQTFEFFRSQTLISCVYLDCVVHGQSNKGNIKVSALQASVDYWQIAGDNPGYTYGTTTDEHDSATV